jgi:hypothetical protein
LWKIKDGIRPSLKVGTAVLEISLFSFIKKLNELFLLYL